MVGRPWWLVYQSNSRAIGWINAIGRTCPCPDSVAPRVVLHSPAGPVLLPPEIRAPHFYCINHARRTYAAGIRYSSLKHRFWIVRQLGHRMRFAPAARRSDAAAEGRGQRGSAQLTILAAAAVIAAGPHQIAVMGILAGKA